MPGQSRQPAPLWTAMRLALTAAVFLSAAMFSLADRPDEGSAPSRPAAGGTAATQRRPATAAGTAAPGMLPDRPPGSRATVIGDGRQDDAPVAPIEGWRASTAPDVTRRGKEIGQRPTARGPDPGTGIPEPPSVANEQERKGTSSSSLPAADLSLLRALAAAPSTVIERSAGTVQIKVHVFAENSDPLRDIRNEPLLGGGAIQRQREAAPDPATAHAVDATPERQPPRPEEPAGGLSPAGPAVSSEGVPPKGPGAAHEGATRDPQSPGAGESPAIAMAAREASDETGASVPPANGQDSQEWGQAALVLGVALMVAAFGAHLAWTRFTRRSPGTVDFWDD